jgi:phosphoribosylformylglycinamidine synthase subunit PurQ / glutaminase
MKFGVVTFPGSNCDHDMLYLAQEVLNVEAVPLWHKDKSIDSFDTSDCIILPGGFSYGDYLRCGALARFSPIMQAITEFAEQGGFVYGICNGFQILCESHLLPGVLLQNTNQKYTCKNIFIKAETTNSAITRDLDPEKALKIPIAHADGRFFADEETLKSLIENDQILFKYCDENGNTDPAFNPNGSLLNIAGICNKGRNVFGMMPHPERASEPLHGNTDGLLLFASLVKSMQERQTTKAF